MGFEKTSDQPKVEKTAEEEAEERRKREKWANEIAGEVEKGMTHMPDGLKEIVASGYGIAAALFGKDKQVGFLKTFLEKRDVGYKSITKIDDALVDSNYDEACRFFEKVIATIAVSKPEKKKKYEDYYKGFKAEHAKKTAYTRRDRERNTEVGNAFQKLWGSFGS